MKNLKFAAIGLALASSVSTAGDCVAPDVPELPNGASANMEQMLAGQKAVKDFQTANLDYMACLEGSLTAAEAAVNEADDDKSKKAAKASYDKVVEAYNGAVSKEEEVAGQFNTEIREYKAANPG